MTIRRSGLFLCVVIALLIFGNDGRAIAQGNAKDLQARVAAALDAYYAPDQYYVTVDDQGKVIIGGQVTTFYDKLNMFQIAAGVKGVVYIEDRVVVNTPLIADDIIKANIVRAIKDNSVILEPDKILVSVDQGLVILKGSVSYSNEKLMAETVASWEDGVLGVDNEIDVLPPQQVKTDENLKSVLNEIVKNKFPLVKDKVSIDVKNGDVTLAGEVGSPWEKISLKKECMRVLGVKNVVDNLIVKAND